MQDAWVDIYKNKKHRKMLFPESPSGAGKVFFEYLKKNNLRFVGNLLDIGCGNGRNAIALAELGFRVYGIDAIPEAIKDAWEKAYLAKLSRRLTFIVGDLSQLWPYVNESMQYAIDINTFGSLLPEERSLYITELSRVLCKNGLFFLNTYTVSDGYYTHFLKGNSDETKDNDIGIEILCTDDNVRRMLYTSEELEKLFGENFTLEHQQDVTYYGKMFDQYYKRHFVGMVFKKSYKKCISQNRYG